MYPETSYHFYKIVACADQEHFSEGGGVQCQKNIEVCGKGEEVRGKSLVIM